MIRVLPLSVILALSVGCIRAPEIVMVDRGTALEQQAAGSFGELERKLSRTSIEARPVPLTPKQFAELGIKPLPLQDTSELTDADLVDGLLIQHCIGEGRNGLLVDTHGACIGAADHAEALELIERVNQARVQLWRWMHEQRKDASVDDLRRTWREVHARGVVCGGWMEAEPGKWDSKQC
ncbi:hypothetical protein AKJ09_07072 [Labilithrix luteola]|uniref:Lipoprotein n=1 Tax=Labilithrix luteola TaxID=1391654 RepID=A0A0K1Q3V4_9BACT|nr:DUF1318 domain-containing protein [Labilithrix luteola]AKV00409.1 hypothetical protein AKJ09_07072 [Labilithrix luteola]